MDESYSPAEFKPELSLKPIIKELARTQVCFPNVKLLVDRVSVVTLPATKESTETQAIRLYLTDGDWTIQAVLKRGCHNHVTSCDVREGSYVILTSYRLSKGRKLSGVGSVIYVIIEDFYSIGEEPRVNVDNERHDRYGELIKTPYSQSIKQLEERHASEMGRHLYDGPYDGYDYKKYDQQHKKEENYSSLGSSPESSGELLTMEMKDVSPRAASAKCPKFVIASPPSKQESRRRDELPGNIVYDSSRHHNLDINEVEKRQSPFQAVSRFEERNSKRNENLGDFDTAINYRDTKIMSPTTKRSATPVNKICSELPARLERNNKIASKHVGVDLLVARKKEMLQSLDVPKKLESVNPKYLALHPSTAKCMTASVATNFTGIQGLLAIKTPLRICTLDSLTGRNATRNKVHDVFAIVCSVQESVVKPPKNMPRKRDIRIMDPSTDKKVLVSIFVDPDNFKPTVGTVALFRNLTTHEWDSGMLNVYHDKCAGKAWFIKDPVDVEGCDVKVLKEWWEKKNLEREDSNVKVFAEKK